MAAKIHPDDGMAALAAMQNQPVGDEAEMSAFLWPDKDQKPSWKCRVIDPGNREEGRQPIVRVRGKEKEVVSRSLFLFSINGRFRQSVLSLVEWRWFDRFILFLILLNSIMLVLQDYRSDPNKGLNWFLNTVAENTLLVFFFIECVAKVIAWGFVLEKHTYLRDAWNILDFICVVSALITTITSPPWDTSSGKKGGIGSQLRMFRMLRPLRSLNAVPELKRLVNTVLAAIPRLVNVMVMAMFLFTIFGVIGITLWGGLFYRQCRATAHPELDISQDPYKCWNWQPMGERVCGGYYDCEDLPGTVCGGHVEDSHLDLRPKFPILSCLDMQSDCGTNLTTSDMQGYPWCEGQMEKAMPEHDFIHFDHIGGAVLIVFQSMTLEGWTDIMYRVQDGGNYWVATIYFFFLVAITSFFLLNVALAVVDESWQELTAEEEEEEGSESQSAGDNPDDEGAEGEAAVQAVPEMEPWFDCRPVRFMQSIVTSDTFGWLIMFFICGNTVMMSMRSFPLLIQFQDTIQFFETFFLVVFTIEMAMLLIGLGPRRYVTNPVTLFDGIIVTISLVSVALGLSGDRISVLRVARLMRILNKIASRWSAFKVLLKAMGLTAISLGYWLVLFVLVLYIFTLMAMAFFATKFHFNDTDTFDRTLEPPAIAGMPAWKRTAWCPGSEEIVEHLATLRMSLPDGTECVPRANFDTFLWAFVTIFQVMSGENWNTIMYAGMRATGWWAVLFFALLILFGQTLFLSLFLTILMSKFDEVQSKLEQDEDKRSKSKSIHKSESRKWTLARQSIAFMGGVGRHSSGNSVGDGYAKQELEGSPEVNADAPVDDVVILGQSQPSATSMTSAGVTPTTTVATKQLAEEESMADATLPGQLGSPRDGMVLEKKAPAPPTAGGREKDGDGDKKEIPLPTALPSTLATDDGGDPTVSGTAVTSEDCKACQAATEDKTKDPSTGSVLPPVHNLSEAAHNESEKPPEKEKAEIALKPKTTGMPERNQSNPGSPSRKHSVTSSTRVNSGRNALQGQSTQSGHEEEAEWPKGYAYFLCTKEHFLRQLCIRIIGYELKLGGVKIKVFDNAILACILISSLCMAIDSPLSNPDFWLTQLIRGADKVFAVVFILEMCIKLVALGLFMHPGSYLRSGWNWLDCIVVVVSIADLAGAGGGSALKTLRILRALRPLRVISRNQNLKVVVKTIFASMPELATLVVVALLFLLIWALFILQYLPGMLYHCDTDGVDGPVGFLRDLGNSFTTPMCLDAALSTSVSEESINYVKLDMCKRGEYRQVYEDFYEDSNDPPVSLFTGEGYWRNGDQTCTSACPELGGAVPWKRASADTPICIGRCKIGGPAITRTVGGQSRAICPASLTYTEELPSVCNVESEPGVAYSAFTEEYRELEMRGVEYIWAMQRAMVMPCGGSWIDENGAKDQSLQGVSCRDTFCPEVSQDKKDSCHNECSHRQNLFCKDVCDKHRAEDAAMPLQCEVCIEECEAACQCRDYCEPLIKDAALCYEQGGQWVDTLQQNFNNLANSMLTLFEILTTEGWVDVMYAACDSTDVYTEPLRDRNLIWAVIFSAWIFFSNMFIINLAVGVVVDNFMELKEKGFMTCLTPSQVKWVNSRKSLWSRAVLFNLTNLHHLPPLRRKVYHLISSKAFEYVIVGTICANTLTMALELFDAEDWWQTKLDVLGYFFSSVFVIEFLLKFYAVRSMYWKDMWNRFDCACILTDMVSRIIKEVGGEDMESNPFVPLLRVLRIFRLFRLLRFVKELNKLFMALVISLPKLFNVCGILVLLLILYSILGVNLFATAPYGETLNYHGNFQNFYFAFITLFRASTGEAWNNIMHDLSRDEEDYYREGSWCTPFDLFETDKKWEVLNKKCLIDNPNSCPMLNAWNILPVLYWVTYTLIISFIIMNLVIAVILEGYEEGRSCPESEVIDMCIGLWKKYDPDQTLRLPFVEAFAYMDEALKHILHEDWHKAIHTRTAAPKELADELRKGATQASLKTDAMASYGIDLGSIPMKYAKIFDFPITCDGKVSFLDSTQQILRFSCIGELREKAPQILVGTCSACGREVLDPHLEHDHTSHHCRRCGGEVFGWRLREKTLADMLVELEDSDVELNQKQPKVAEKLKHLREAQTFRQGSFVKKEYKNEAQVHPAPAQTVQSSSSGTVTAIGIREHVAAAKIQQAFHNVKVRRERERVSSAPDSPQSTNDKQAVMQITKVEELTAEAESRGERTQAELDEELRATAKSEDANGLTPPMAG
mmetsp:Transcript_29439/g.68551  ORF Transcript_29439/g.68551 Transcript_29439/m.68551 type:complete len:2248 (+) Transcript_29439:46-6789(+)|eukprot:CAMPEP_0178381032 /NCGR_PEP_ID=MMETSP0689_2-20121128/5772_1 /TAXON_ID=160604 /ORGANISM="Amphidinium massartii, Strain CS-259" /LENGTH=2247 /DNA_ID=CAMNT_0020001199 /DNA_START=39 /DNA_END=6782 /DNA_ORIENTATION=-